MTIDVRQTQFTIPVDYTLTLEAMIASGCYDGMNKDITSKHFPVKARDNGDITVHLVHFDKELESDDATIARLDAIGLRPAELPELLALGAKHPGLQREFPIIALGSVWKDRGGRRLVPGLSRGGAGRRLDLVWFDSRWFRNCRFAAVSK